MLVHRMMKMLEDFLRARVQVCAHGCVLLLSPRFADRVARVRLCSRRSGKLAIGPW
jgi:hypothetical protein